MLKPVILDLNTQNYSLRSIAYIEKQHKIFKCFNLSELREISSVRKYYHTYMRVDIQLNSERYDMLLNVQYIQQISIVLKYQQRICILDTFGFCWARLISSNRINISDLVMQELINVSQSVVVKPSKINGLKRIMANGQYSADGNG